MGHFTPYLHLSNKLAERGHRISFIVPQRTQTKLHHLNLNPHLITFVIIKLPHVHGLLHHAETTKDIQLLLRDLNPHIVFFDFQHWLPSLTGSLGIKSVAYLIVHPELTELDLMEPPPGFPDSCIKFQSHELRFLAEVRKLEFGRPLLPEPPNTSLEEKWISWLGGFNPGSVIFCAYGSESQLSQNQLQELLLGLELTGFPFLAALKPPDGFESIEEALPEGFGERVKGRGIAYGGWVQQQLILGHPSVGCFITHCGASSVTEALVNKCGLVLLPRLSSDHIMNAKIMSMILKVGVEVEKGEEDGLFTKESLCKAVKTVMDDGNEIGREVRQNHAKLRNFLLSDNLESSCLDSFCQQLRDLCNDSRI
ncbi:hypothetical protein V8G54_026515 [Vigna mungo]|uniref:Uncharacterized protein n=1 Tax=Vigna mungo TaxID=3915 RepID=A0AAQ3N0I5_VIGMU